MIRPKANVFDLIFAGVLSFMLCGGAVRLCSDPAYPPSSDASVQFEIQGIDPDMASLFDADRILSLSGTAEPFGVTVESEITPYYMCEVSDDGEFVMKRSSSLVTVRASAVCKGRFSELGFLLGRNRFLSPNMTLHISNSAAEWKIYIKNIGEAKT